MTGLFFYSCYERQTKLFSHRLLSSLKKNATNRGAAVVLSKIPFVPGRLTYQKRTEK